MHEHSSPLSLAASLHDCGSVAEDRLNEGQGGSGTQHQILPFKLDGKIINAIRYWFRISGDGILME